MVRDRRRLLPREYSHASSLAASIALERRLSLADVTSSAIREAPGERPSSLGLCPVGRAKINSFGLTLFFWQTCCEKGLEVPFGRC